MNPKNSSLPGPQGRDLPLVRMTADVEAACDAALVAQLHTLVENHHQAGDGTRMQKPPVAAAPPAAPPAAP